MSSPTPLRAAPDAPATKVRWLVLGLLFAVTTMNYADRATISIAGADIRRALDLSPVQMGYIFSAFAWSYVAAQLPGGWLLDRFGSKTTYLCGLVLWSLFTMFQGAVGFLAGGTAAAALFVLRLAVGAAEAPSFPGNGRITSAWFPAGERGLASAIFNSAQYFATALFAPIMGWIVHTFGNTAGITTPIVIGYILQATGSFAGALTFVGASAAIALLSMLLLVGDIHRVELKQSLTRTARA